MIFKFIFKIELIIILIFKLLLKYKLEWSKDKNWENIYVEVINIECVKKFIILIE